MNARQQHDAILFAPDRVSDITQLIKALKSERDICIRDLHDTDGFNRRRADLVETITRLQAQLQLMDDRCSWQWVDKLNERIAKLEGELPAAQAAAALQALATEFYAATEERTLTVYCNGVPEDLRADLVASLADIGLDDYTDHVDRIVYTTRVYDARKVDSIAADFDVRIEGE